MQACTYGAQAPLEIRSTNDEHRQLVDNGHPDRTVHRHCGGGRGRAGVRLDRRVAELTSLIAPAIAPAELKERQDLGEVSAAIRRYHAGEFDAVDGIAVRQQSGAFRERAWEVLRTVKPGAPVTYADYATLAGSPTAVRAAASACARNAAALFVPCHRVVRTGGALGGFRWGVDTKRWLLTHEISTN
jgi:methylated-DNA-[protein]-cysteine S-methyltransferase